MRLKLSPLFLAESTSLNGRLNTFQRTIFQRCRNLLSFVGLSIIFISIAACQSPAPTKEAVTGKATPPQSVKVYTTAKDTKQRLALTDEKTFSPSTQPSEGEVSIFIYPQKSFQTFLGIGSAITDASAEVFAQLPASKQSEFIDAFFDREKGIGYTLSRTPIHSSDFSSASYTYIDEGDKSLETFSIEPDRKYRIPLIKKALEKTQGELTLFASPWSPPAFMKNTNNMLKGGHLLPEYRTAWATYYTKFIKAYEKEGIPIWGISIQNEPMAVQRWESNIYTAEQERDFLRDYLGPIMHKEGLADKKIIVWDHNRDLITHRAHTIFSDPEAAKYAWGIGFHWYEPWAGGKMMHDNLRAVHESFPDKHLIFTEGTVEDFEREHYQYWPNAEKYGYSMINDFNAGTVGWTDWNILLDENGGPNHVGNYCFAPVHGDTRTGELIYTPTYYYIGHFSKFIRPGAKRISATSSRSHLLTTAFQNIDGSIASVVMNNTDKRIQYNFILNEQKIEMEIPAHAIQTLLH